MVLSLLPLGALAEWSNPGEDFSAALTLGGPVTHNRNPWRWQMATGETGMDVSLERQQRVNADGEWVWQGLMDSRALLLGKTTLRVPTGRDGLTPRVVFGRHVAAFALNWRANGEAEVHLPVYSVGSAQTTIGAFRFRLQAAGMIRQGPARRARYASLYNDQAGNGLPPQGLTMAPGQAAAQLCVWFGGEGPAWLCPAADGSVHSEPLSRFSEAGVSYPAGVYGAVTVAGSGELRLKAGHRPTQWRVALPISIEYQ